MAGRKIDPDIPAPNGNSAQGTWDFHVWRKDHNGDVWIGFFADARTALDWVKTQFGSVFEVNNVPPPTSTRFRERVTVAPRQKTTPRKTVTVRDPFRVPARPVNVPVVAPPKPKPKVVVEDKEVVKLRRSAKVRLDKHIADEAADMASGKIENV